MRNIIFPGILIFTLVSCSALEPGEYIYNLWASVNKIEVTHNRNGRLYLDVYLTIPTPCHQYHRRDMKISGDTVYVRYYTKIKKETVCIQVLSDKKITDSIELERRKNYLFKFWQLGGSYLDTLIYIN